MSAPFNDAVFDVERSVTGKRWRLREADERLAAALAQDFALEDSVARILAMRCEARDAAAEFLGPTLRRALPDPSHLKDMDAAVARIVAAVNAGETIAVFGDYDVDGATSAALLVRFFRALGRTVPVYIPDRTAEGYGPNIAALRKLKAAGASLVVTVDCGTTAFDPLEEAVAEGLDVIVIDHHVAAPRLPAGCLVVNPNRVDDDSPHGQLAAVGVTFLLAVAVNRALRDAFWYGEGHAEPDLMRWLDLVALGTVCDVVPLRGINRALACQGLKVMAERGNPGIAALADVAGVTARLDAYHAGFVLGPRVNAGGRVGDPGLGVRLLSSDDPAEVQALAQRLNEHNRERQAVEQGVLASAMEQAERQAGRSGPLILVAGEGWHPGVIGIVAGRLRERFDLPSCVVSLTGGVGKGSGRSIPGVGLGPAVIAAHQAGHLVNGGGHEMAAGFTVEAAKLDVLRDFLADHIGRQLGGAVPQPALSLDAALAPGGATLALREALDRLGPFGAGNPRPRFALPQARIVRADIVGADHVRCIVSGGDGASRLKAIAFRAAGSPLGNALLNTRGGPLHLAGTLRLDEWQGRREAQLYIDDAATVA